LAIVASLLGARPIPARADLIVSDWYLATGVQNLAPPSQQDSQSFSVVSNPFLDSHSAQLGPGTATTSYDFSWSGDNASFRIDAAHVPPDLGNYLYVSASQGSIQFRTSAPLLAHFTGAYIYSLPFPAADVVTSFLLKDIQTNARFINQSGFDDTILHAPPRTGTFTWDRTAVIPAGTDCLVLYGMEINARRNTGQLATGSGFFQLTLEPVPEPAALPLLIAGVPLMRRTRSPR